MIDFKERNPGVVVRPGGSGVTVEIVDNSRPRRTRHVLSNKLCGLRDSLGRDDVPRKLRTPEATVSIRNCSGGIEDRYLVSTGVAKIAEVASQHPLCGNRDDVSTCAVARKEKAQTSEKESLIAAVVDMRNDDRAA